jgi:periplasmic protein TonB
MELSIPQQSALSLREPLKVSVAFHLFLLASLAVSTLLSHRGETWGGAGGEGSINMNLVGSIPAVPLPKPDVVTTNRTVDTTKGLYTEEPQPKTKPPEDQHPLYIPQFDRYKEPKYTPSRPSKVLPNPTQTPPNAIPYGHGGAPQIPYTSFVLGQATPGGMGISGTSGGAFGTQFPWYVEAVQRRVSSNWLQATVDPTISWAPRCVVNFEILRDGTITNIQLTQSSGNQSVDMSAVRAVHSSNPLDRLPPEYRGSYVNVEFWFDFKRQQ